jgi:hypothetical protein
VIKVRLAGADGTGGRLRNYDLNTAGADEPDDRAIADAVAAVPELPCSWWIRMTLDPDDTPVSANDVRLVFLHIRHRLAGQEATTGALPPPADAIPARLLPSEGQDSGQAHSSATVGELFDSITTVGQLHEAIDTSNAWSTFTACWCEACGVEEPKKEEKHNPKTASDSILAAELHGKPALPLLPLPADAPLLEEGLHRSLSEMPQKVAAFLLHTPPDPPAWRYSESPNEKAVREQLEAEGCWTG